MGCGASVLYKPRRAQKLSGGGSDLPPLAAPRPTPLDITPPGSAAGSARSDVRPLNTRPAALSIYVPTKVEPGMADTPVGKAAEDFKYFCPLCMMFYKSIMEMNCCQQYTCSHCLNDYVLTKLAAKPGIGAPASAALSDRTNGREAGAAAPPLSAQPPPAAEGEGHLPRGLSCPHCNVSSDGRPLRVLRKHDEARSYLNSPQTSQQLAELSSARDSLGSNSKSSPLRVGDDYAAMARKMLPFSTEMGRVDDISDSKPADVVGGGREEGGDEAGSARALLFAPAAAEGAGGGDAPHGGALVGVPPVVGVPVLAA